MSIQDLIEMSKDIEKDFITAETQLNIIGQLNIKIRSFQNALSKTKLSESEEYLKQNSIKFSNKLKILTAKKMQEKSNIEKEMKSSNLKFREINEQSNLEEFNLEEKDFFSQQSERLDSLISSTMDSFEGLRKQGAYIDDINDKLKIGLNRMGVSGSLISKIESRAFGDKTLFICLLILVIFLMFMLRFIFK